MTSPHHRATLLAAGRGGVGTSTAAVLHGLAAAGRGQRTLLVDGAEYTPALGPLLGIPGTPGGLGLVVRGVARPEELLLEVDDGLDLLPGGDPRPEFALRGGRGHLVGAYRAVAHLHGAYDRVFIDGGSRLDTIVAAVGAGVGRVGLLTTGDPVSLAGAYAVMKVLHADESSVPDVRVGVVLNRAGEGEGADESAVRYLREAADRFLGVDLTMAGTLPWDPEGVSALTEGRREEFTASRIAHAASELLLDLPEEASGFARKSLPSGPVDAGRGTPGTQQHRTLQIVD